MGRRRRPKVKPTSDSLTNQESLTNDGSKNDSSVIASNSETGSMNAINVNQDIESSDLDSVAMVQTCREKISTVQSNIGTSVTETERSVDVANNFEVEVVSGADAAKRPVPMNDSAPDQKESRGFDLPSENYKNFDVSTSALQSILDSLTFPLEWKLYKEGMPSRQSLEKHQAETGHFKRVVPDCSYEKCSASDFPAHLSNELDMSANLMSNQVGNDDVDSQLPVTTTSTKNSSRKTPFPLTPPNDEGPVAPQLTEPKPQKKAVNQPNSEIVQHLSNPVTNHLLEIAREWNTSPIEVESPPIASPSPTTTLQQIRMGPAHSTPRKLPVMLPLGSRSTNKPQQAAGKEYLVMIGSDQSGQNLHPQMNSVVAQPHQQLSIASTFSMARSRILTARKEGSAPAVKAQKRTAVVTQAAGRSPQPTKQRFVTVTPISRPLESPTETSKRKPTAVVNFLANRGVSLTPFGGNPIRPQVVTATQPVQARGQPVSVQARSQPVPVQARRQLIQAQVLPTLNLSSSISVTPLEASRTNSHPQTKGPADGQFARSQRPQPISFGQSTTIDLTGEDEPSTPVRSSPWPNATPVQTDSLGTGQVGRPGNQERPTVTCPVCDKCFSQRDELAPHLLSHVDQPAGKFIYKCSVCTAEYTNKSTLTRHVKTYHANVATREARKAREANSAPSSEEDFVVPVMSLRECGGPAGLRAMGVRHYIRLSDFGIQSNEVCQLPAQPTAAARKQAE